MCSSIFIEFYKLESRRLSLITLHYINQFPIKSYKLIRSVFYNVGQKALDTRRKILNVDFDVF